MPRKQTTRGGTSGQWSTMNPNAAGLDVGATFHVVAVAPERDEQSVRTFGTFSSDLHRLADWLQKVGITTVAMESTGVYWIPVCRLPLWQWLLRTDAFAWGAVDHGDGDGGGHGGGRSPVVRP